MQGWLGNSYCTQGGGGGLSGYNKSCPAIARNASGEVHVFLPDFISPQSIFWSTELGMLRHNSRVQGIIVHRLRPRSIVHFNSICDSSAPNSECLAVLRDHASWELPCPLKYARVRTGYVTASQLNQGVPTSKNNSGLTLSRLRALIMPAVRNARNRLHSSKGR